MTDSERIVDQPLPTPNTEVAIADLVILDIAERRRIGTERYGTPLQAHNGRAAFIDMYQELLDAAQYARQIIEETPEAETWAIIYEDPDHRVETFFGEGAEEAARRRFADARKTWNCTLFRQYAPLGWETPTARDAEPTAEALRLEGVRSVRWLFTNSGGGRYSERTILERIDAHIERVMTRSGLPPVAEPVAEPVEPEYNPIPLDLTDPRLAYLLDPTADVDESVVIWERVYREKDRPLMYGEKGPATRMLDGCSRCQNGLHWQCHGCSCPCSDSMERYGGSDDQFREWVARVRAIGPYHLNDPKERALVGDPA